MFYYFQFFENNILNILLYSLFLYSVSYIILKLYYKAYDRFIYSKIIDNDKDYKLDKTRIHFLKGIIPFVAFLLITIFIFLTVPSLKKKTNYIFSSLAVFSIIVAYAARFSFSNIMGGVFIFLYKPFSLGDYVQVKYNEKLKIGKVVDITFRDFIIKDGQNNHLIIPNSLVAKEPILNYTIFDSSICILNHFKVDLHADIDLSKKIILQEIKKSKYVLPKTDMSLFINRVEDGFVELSARLCFANIKDHYNFKYNDSSTIYRKLIDNNCIKDYKLVGL